MEHAQTGERGQIKARYLLGIDGAGSTVRRALGFAMIGEDGTTHRAFMGGTMLSFFIRSPTLMAASRRPPTNMTWIINPEMRGMMYSQDGRETWVIHYQVPPGTDWRAVDAPAVVRGMIGADVPFEIISGGPWTGGLALVAEHYQSGRVFLAGDAAHLFTPLGGLGMNTGIGDVMNLCWKLAAVHQGWAGPRLIESYEVERRPIGVRNSQLGVRCTRIMDGWVLPPGFEDDSASADAARRGFGARIIEEDRAQYLTVGIQLGERYEHSPIVWPDDDNDEPAGQLGYLHASGPPRRTRTAFLAGAEARGLRRVRQGADPDRFRRARRCPRVRSRRRHARRSAEDIATETSRGTLPQQARAGSSRPAHRLAWRCGRRRHSRDRSRARGVTSTAAKRNITLISRWPWVRIFARARKSRLRDLRNL